MCVCKGNRNRERRNESKEKISKGHFYYFSQHTEDGRMLDSINHTVIKVPKLQVNISIMLAPQNVHIIQFITLRATLN